MDDLEVVLDEKLPGGRVVVGGLVRQDAVAVSAPLQIARRGAFVALDHVGLDDDAHVTDRERAVLVAELVKAGHGNRVLLSSNAIGVAKGQPGYDLPYSYVLSTFVPFLTSQGLSDEDVQRILADNPRELLSVR
jgi:phosphotriesterase-related protein